MIIISVKYLMDFIILLNFYLKFLFNYLIFHLIFDYFKEVLNFTHLFRNFPKINSLFPQNLNHNHIFFHLHLKFLVIKMCYYFLFFLY
jgi:hypothetical protein